MLVTVRFSDAAGNPAGGHVSVRAPRQTIADTIVQGTVLAALDGTGTATVDLLDGLEGLEVQDRLTGLPPSPWHPWTPGEPWPTQTLSGATVGTPPCPSRAVAPERP